MKIRKNDTVQVMVGRSAGKRGKVHRMYPGASRVVVEGVNIIKRHTKPRGMAKQAGIVEREASIHISNVMLLCPRCGKPARVGFRPLEEGKKARVCRRCKEVID